MKRNLFVAISAIALLLCPSCITAAVTAAAASGAGVAGGTVGTGIGLKSISDLMSSDAPESLADRSLVCKGDFNGELKADDGTYTRETEKTAELTMGTEVFHLTFTGSSEGSYVYENRAEDGSVTTGHGTFTLK